MNIPQPPELRGRTITALLCLSDRPTPNLGNCPHSSSQWGACQARFCPHSEGTLGLSPPLCLLYVQCPLPWGHSILFWDRLPGKVRQHLPGVHLSRPRTESTAGRGGLGRAALESPGHFWALLERAAVFTHCAGNSELTTLVLAHLSSEFPVSLHLLCVRVLVCSSTLPFPKPFSCLCSHSPHPSARSLILAHPLTWWALACGARDP